MKPDPYRQQKNEQAVCSMCGGPRSLKRRLLLSPYCSDCMARMKARLRRHRRK